MYEVRCNVAVTIFSGQALADVLVELDMLPPECVDVELVAPLDGVWQMKYTVNITSDDLKTLSEAFRLLAERYK